MSQQNEWAELENEREIEEQQQQKIETDNRCERILNEPYNNVEFMDFTDLYNVIKKKSQWLKYKYDTNNNNENSTFKDQIDIIKRLIEKLKPPNFIRGFLNSDTKKYNNAKLYIFDDINLNQIFDFVDGAVKTNHTVSKDHNQDVIAPPQELKKEKVDNSKKYVIEIEKIEEFNNMIKELKKTIDLQVIDKITMYNNELIEGLNFNQKGGLKHKTNKNRKKKQKNKKTKSTRRRRR